MWGHEKLARGMFFGCSVLTFFFIFHLAWVSVSLFLQSSIIPTSDYVHVVSRYINYLSGASSFWDFILTKHVDHNHALVYLMSYLDIVLGDGDLAFLSYGQLLSNIAVFFVYGYLIFLAGLNRFVSAVCIAFVASQIFSVYSMELWVFPFQFVLASFRLLLVLGVFLFCRAVLVTSAGFGSYVFSLVVLLVASLSHGSGILIPLVVGIVCFLAWFRAGRIFTKFELFSLFLFFLAFGVHEAVYASGVGASGILKGIDASEWANIPVYLGYLLGYSFAWESGALFKIFSGVLGVLLYFTLAFALLRSWSRPLIELPLIALGGFFLSGALLSVLINLGYAEYRGVEKVYLDYFLSSRYMSTVSGFWLSLVIMCFSWLSRVRSSFLVGWLGVLVCSLCLLSSVSSLFVKGFSSESEWAQTLSSQRVTEKYLRSWRADGLPRKSLTDLLYVSDGMYDKTLQVLEFQRSSGLGVFSDSASYLDEVDDFPANLVDANWVAGISRSAPVILVANTKSNIRKFLVGRKIEFSSGSREILKQESSGVYLMLVLGGKVLSPDVDGYPNKFKVVE